MLLQNHGQHTQVRENDIALFAIKHGDSDNRHGTHIACNICPHCTPLPEALVRLVRAKHEQDGQETTHKFVGPSWH